MSAPVVRRAAEIRPEPVAGATGTTRAVLVGPADGAPHFALRKFVFAPGGGMPLHTNEVEHEQYVLAGEADVRLGTETRRVRAGDAVYIPARTPHAYKVVGHRPFELLCVVPNLPDTPRILAGD